MATAQSDTVKTVDPRTLQGWLTAGDAVLVDVREPGMHAAERIAGARSIPLATLTADRVEARPGQRLVFQCEVGVASAKAARQVAEAGRSEVYNLGGGIAAWKQAGLPVTSDPGAPLPLFRQVQLVAGSLVVLGVVLGRGGLAVVLCPERLRRGGPDLRRARRALAGWPHCC